MIQITHISSMPQAPLLQAKFVMLKGIEYNSSTKGKCASDEEIVPINCESEKWDTEVEKDKKVSFDNVTNAG